MHARDFRYWLHGYFEIRGTGTALSRQQVAIIRRHLELVRNIDGVLAGFELWLDGVLEKAADHRKNTGIIDKALERSFTNVTR